MITWDFLFLVHVCVCSFNATVSKTTLDSTRLGDLVHMYEVMQEKDKQETGSLDRRSF